MTDRRMRRAGTTTPLGRIPGLDGLRGLAILLVLWWHMYACVERPAWVSAIPGFDRLALRGWSGVLLFFVLSGFLLGRILIRHRGEKGYYRTFYIRRAVRILPLYYICFGLYLAARSGLTATNPALSSLLDNSPIPVWPYVCFFQNLAMAMMGGGSAWLGVTWSLAVEEQFYLLLPLLVAVTPRPSVGTLAFLLVIAAPILRFVCLHWELADPAVPTLLLPTQLDGFAFGLLAGALLEKSEPISSRTAHWLLVVSLVTFIGLELVMPYLRGWHRTGCAAVSNTSVEFLYMSLVLCVVTSPQAAVTRALQIASLVRVGRISYFVYLFHLPAQYFSHWLLRDAVPSLQTGAGFTATAGALGVTFATGEMSRRILEEPLIRWGHRHAKWLDHTARHANSNTHAVKTVN